MSSAWRLTAGYSTGFKAPSFNDLYFPGFSNRIAGDSQNAEIGAYWNSSYGDVLWQARAIGYHNRVRTSSCSAATPISIACRTT
jgi:vitamin B12 transporter